MSVCIIIEITILNRELYSKYVEKVPEIVKKYGGKYLIRGGEIIPISGNRGPERTILIEFDTLEKLKDCFSSEEYLAIEPFRENSTTTKSVTVNGYPSTKLFKSAGF